jgi:hypothetical protein
VGTAQPAVHRAPNAHRQTTVLQPFVPRTIYCNNEVPIRSVGRLQLKLQQYRMPVAWQFPETMHQGMNSLISMTVSARSLPWVQVGFGVICNQQPQLTTTATLVALQLQGRAFSIRRAPKTPAPSAMVHLDAHGKQRWLWWVRPKAAGKHWLYVTARVVRDPSGTPHASTRRFAAVLANVAAESWWSQHGDQILNGLYVGLPCALVVLALQQLTDRVRQPRRPSES